MWVVASLDRVMVPWPGFVAVSLSFAVVAAAVVLPPVLSMLYLLSCTCSLVPAEMNDFLGIPVCDSVCVCWSLGVAILVPSV